MTEPLQARVSAALARVVNPRVENDLLSAGMIRDLEVNAEDGRVSFTFLLGRDDPATLVREARAAVRAVEGVQEIKIDVQDPAGKTGPTHAPPGAQAGGAQRKGRGPEPAQRTASTSAPAEGGPTVTARRQVERPARLAS